MMSGNVLSAMILHKLIKNIFNGSTCATVDDAIGNAVETMRSLIILSGDDYQSSTKCLESS